MNRKQLFQTQYRQALIKVGIGIYSIRLIGEKEGMDDDDIEMYIERWANILAKGVGLPLTSVIADGKKTCDNFPAEFVNSHEFNNLIGELGPSLLKAEAIPVKR